MFSYDHRGRRASRALPNGATTRYSYDVEGLLASLNHDGQRVDIQRDLVGREVWRHVERANKASADIFSAYDARDRLTSQDVRAPRPDGYQAFAALSQRRWKYDAAGRVSSIDDARWGTATYGYDRLGRLLMAIRGPHRELFEYDGAGSLTGALDGLDRVGGASRWSATPGNLLVETPDASYENDEHGRRVAKTDKSTGQRSTYVWDTRDQLREVFTGNGCRVRYTYDAFGRRVRKEIVGQHASTVTEFLWDGDVLCAEFDSARGPRVFVHASGRFDPVLQQEQGGVFTYVNDHHGMPKELIDEDGRVAWSAAHSAWGAVVQTWRDPEAKRAVDTPFRMLGQYLDEETDLCYTRFRYFDAAVGRWMSPDPLGIDGGENLFGWNGSPSNEVDPLGLSDLPRYDGPKPTYEVNPAHVPGQGLRSANDKTPLPSDAEDVYKNAVPDDPVAPRNWYGKNADGDIYRYSAANGKAHFSGTDGEGDGTRNITKYAKERLENCG